MYNKILLLFALVLNSYPVCCQYSLSGMVIEGIHKNPVEGVEIILTANDTLVSMDITNMNGEFSMPKVLKGEYTLHIAHPGYSLFQCKYNLQQNTNIELMLHREMNVALDSIVITANRNDRIKRTATGLIFQLSEQAKNSGNPFRALQEIPQLISDEASASVKMEDGNVPLVLIDGNRMNSGISPINPKDIESVEIVNVISARYLKEGIRHILNIKLKQKTKPFLFFETMNRHNIPLNRGMGAVYFEIGNPDYSVYSRIAGEYLYKDKITTSDWQKNEGYHKQTHEVGENNKKNWLGELLFKWKATEKDYFAAHIYGNEKLSKLKKTGDGMLYTENEQLFNLYSSSQDDSYILTGSLYHKHSFAGTKTIETTLAFNKNQNQNESNRKESYPEWAYDNLYRFKNSRVSGTLNIDYSSEWGKNSINIGSETHFLKDRINQVSNNEPTFHHQEWSEYLYTVFVSNIQKFQYMVSIGMEAIWLKAGGVSNHYLKPRGSVSGTYNFDDNNSLQASYVLSNTTPSIAMLNPYNTSTDSLVVNQGNPFLHPEQNHALNASYTYNKKGFYFAPAVTYQINTDLIEPYGFSKQGIYTASYRNGGRYRKLAVGASVSYRLKWGRLYGQVEHLVDYYPTQAAKKSFHVDIGAMAQYKKFSFYANCSYNNYIYTPISRTKHLSPSYSNVQITYNLNKDLYVSACLEYLTGAIKTKTSTYSENYQSFSSITQNDKNLRPWILIRYTFRKNKERKIKLDNIISSKEEGISLKE